MAKHSVTKIQKVDWLMWICIGVGILGFIVMLIGLPYRTYGFPSDTPLHEQQLLEQRAAISIYGLYLMYLGAVLGYFARELNPKMKNRVDRLAYLSLSLGVISGLSSIFFSYDSSNFLGFDLGSILISMIVGGVALASGVAARQTSVREDKVFNPKWAFNAVLIIGLLSVLLPIFQLVFLLTVASEL